MSLGPLSFIAALVSTPKSEARSRLIHDAAHALLADPRAISALAERPVGKDDGEEWEAAAAPMSRALDEARMAQENGAPEGAALIEAAERALSARDADTPFPPTLRLRLAQIYARAGLPPTQFALLTPETIDDVNAESLGTDGIPDIGAALDAVFREAGDEPPQVHAALSELFAGLPAELGALLVGTTVARSGTIEAQLGLYWLLDREPAIRSAAATALLQRAHAGGLGPDVGALLPTIRKWLPEDPARDALDAAIRRLMRDGAARSTGRAPTTHRAAASLPDGAGAQSLIAAVQAGGRRAVAMLMLKQGHGVKDAFIIPCASATEQKRMVGRVLGEIETFDIAPGYIAEALAVSLGEGVALGAPPAPGLVDIIAFWGGDALSPAPSAAEDILAAIGAPEELECLSKVKRDALVDASADWVERFEQSDAWFEDTGPLRAAITRARTDKGRETAVWKHLETRRLWWARQFAVSGATLKAQIKPDPSLWLSFAAVAQGLLDQRPLKRVPIMVDITKMTLEAFDAREGGAAPSAPRLEAQDEIGHLLAQAGISEAYLQGYLTALAISPLAPSAEAWLGPLLGGIEFSGEATLNRLLELVMLRASQIDQDAADPATVSGAIAALDTKALREWAGGFDDLVTAAKPAWPAKALAANDKRILKDIASVSKGGDPTALRTLLPAWVAWRHSLRR